MARWRVVYDPKTDALRYGVKRGFGHSLLAPVMTVAFAELGISASLWEPSQGWLPLYGEPSASDFELEHGIEGRGAYNQACLERARVHKKTVRGEYLGLFDLFVPVVVAGAVEAVIVAGPFLRSRPTSEDIQQRWRSLSGRRGHPSDPEFAAYLTALQRALVLDEKESAAFEAMSECVAELYSGQGDAEKIANRASALRAKLASARLIDRMWQLVHTIIDERSSRTGFSVHRAVELRRMGLTRIADHVLVALVSNKTPVTDAVDEAVRLHAFQRDASVLARRLGDILAGQVGNRGVVLLTGASGPVQRKRARVSEIAEQLSKLARTRHGFSLHLGVSAALKAQPLSSSYLVALAAAESALAGGERMATAEQQAPGTATALREVRRQLDQEMEERPELLEARFERYVESVAVQCSNRMEPARAHLEVGFEKIAEPLLAKGALDEKTLRALWAALDRSVAAARTMPELCSVYRRAASDLFEAMKRPVQARRDRSLRLALEYVRQHYTEPLRLEQVAKVAGFTPSHFSKLFIKRERMPFEHYVRALRLERAKHLLVSTDIDSTRVAELSGFASLQYFCRVFRRELGTTPLEYRAKPDEGDPTRAKSPHQNSRKATKRPRHAAKLIST